jgi:hypothetical protein
MNPVLTIVLTPDTRDAAIAAETAPVGRPGFFTIDVPPAASRDLADVAEAVLVGLGKDHRLSTQRRFPIPVATAWLSLGEHTDAVVWDAAQLPDQLLSELIEWLNGQDLHVWLLMPAGPYVDANGTGERIDRLAAGWGAEIIGHRELEGRWPAPIPVASAPPTSLPVLPRVDGTVFRQAMRDLLAPDAFAAIDARYVALVNELRAEVRNLGGTNKTRRFEQLLRNRMHDTGPLEELHLLARAAQVAGLHEGFHVSVNPVAFFGGAAAVPRRGQAVDERWWEKLDAYRDPDVGAVAALYLAGVDLQDVRHITPDMVTDLDGHLTVTIDDQDPVEIPEPGARFVRALVMWRLLIGGGPDDVLLTNHRTMRVSAAYSSALAQTPMEAGVAIVPTPVRPKHPSAKAWLERYGIKISKLAYSPVAA